MPARLRVFISSTQDDLPNERREVAKCLRTFNFEAVNAEDLSPSGEGSWETIREEIDSCDLMILILGQRYGWVPDKGPGGGEGLSVTHMEFNHARKKGLTILPFFKKLSVKAPQNQDQKDAELRDKFRKDVADWADGYFRGREFEYADDLADQVRAAVGRVVGDVFRKSKRRRAEVVDADLSSPDFSFPEPIEAGQWILVAGAGMSLQAGYPSGLALAQALLSKGFPEIESSQLLQGYRFTEIAAAFEAGHGRPALEKAAAEVFAMPMPPAPTAAHRQAVRMFPAIITTNYDDLFERAAAEEGINFCVVTPFDNPAAQPKAGQLVIYKNDGSATKPASLVMTDDDAERARANGAYWTTVEELLKSHPVVVVGHSIRDANTRRILQQRSKTHKGLYVTPTVTSFDQVLLGRFGLKAIKADANTFLQKMMQRQKP